MVVDSESTESISSSSSSRKITSDRASFDATTKDVPKRCVQSIVDGAEQDDASGDGIGPDPTAQDSRVSEKAGLATPQVVLWGGIVAQLSLHKTLKYLAQLQTSSSISAKQCFVLNAILFLGSIVLFNVLLTPLLERIGSELESLDIALRKSDAADERPAELAAQWEHVQARLQEVSSSLFQIFWLGPMYLVSILLNAVFNVDIAKQVYTVEFGTPAKGLESIPELIRDSMYNYLLMGWVSLFCFGVFYVQIIGPVVSLLWTSWAIAFYAYDLVWALRGWDLQKRLRVFQRHWVFMIGFGFPSALATFLLPQFLGYGVYALAFPVSIILAITSTPLQHTPSKFFPKSVRIFFFAEYINLLLLRVLGLHQTNQGKKSEHTK